MKKGKVKKETREFSAAVDRALTDFTERTHPISTKGPT
jgi:hypothetical protein